MFQKLQRKPNLPRHKRRFRALPKCIAAATACHTVAEHAPTANGSAFHAYGSPAT